METLAIFGGKKTFGHPFEDTWKRPKDLEKKLVSALLDRNEVSGSGYGISKAFEESLKKYIDCEYCLAFSHGSAALMAAYFAAGVGPGDEIITPATGYLLSYAGALHLGARPVFCDIDESTLLIDPNQVRKKITPRTKAIDIIHMNGRVCNLDELIQISEEFGIPIVDDACHADGAEWGGRKLGNFNHVTCFSFQGAPPKGKPIGAGEGGAACTNNKESYQKMLAYCHLHRHNIKAELAGSPFEYLDEEVLGLKFRPHPLALAIGLISLESLDNRNAKRLENYQKTAECLKEFEFITAPKIHEKAKMAGFVDGLKFIYKPEHFDNISIQIFIQSLLKEGVPIIGPMLGPREYRRYLFTHSFDLWEHGRGPIDGPWCGLDKFQPPDPKEFPVSEKMAASVFTLPSFIDVEQEYFECLKKAFSKVRENRKFLVNIR